MYTTSNGCQQLPQRCLWTTKLYITTTISITIAVYNERWARMVGLRHCISQGEFFFFAFLALFLLKWYSQLEPLLSWQMPNFHTQTRTNGARDATHLECKGMFFFLFLFFCFFFFFLILLTFFTDHINQLNKCHLDHHIRHLNIFKKHQSGHHHLDSPWKWWCSNNPVLAPNHSNGRAREMCKGSRHIFSWALASGMYFFNNVFY